MQVFVCKCVHVWKTKRARERERERKGMNMSTFKPIIPICKYCCLKSGTWDACSDLRYVVTVRSLRAVD